MDMCIDMVVSGLLGGSIEVVRWGLDTLAGGGEGCCNCRQVSLPDWLRNRPLQPCHCERLCHSECDCAPRPRTGLADN